MLLFHQDLRMDVYTHVAGSLGQQVFVLRMMVVILSFSQNFCLIIWNELFGVHICNPSSFNKAIDIVLLRFLSGMLESKPSRGHCPKVIKDYI